MAVFYKFKSARDYNSIPMDDPFISVGALKEKICQLKYLSRGTDVDLQVTNAQTNEEYTDEAMLIPKNTSVLIRRIPRWTGRTIVIEKEPKLQETQTEKIGFDCVEYSDDDDFGSNWYDIPEATPVQSLPVVRPPDKADEDSKIKALIDTPVLDWKQGKGSDGGHGFGLDGGTPRQGYVCHRCNVPGHFIKYCPTNGDPKFDVKMLKHPTGIPKSMLIANAIRNSETAVLRANEAAFEKEMEGLSSTSRSIGHIPPQLHCSLCKEVMRDAVLTGKCCFNSFCNQCIKDEIISKAMCVCGVKNILADDLIPNITLRETIKRILDFGTSSGENASGITFQVEDTESGRCPLQPKVPLPSPTLSTESKGEQKRSPEEQEQPMSKATNVSKSIKKTASPRVETAPRKKMEKKKDEIPTNDLQWKTPQVEKYMMPVGPYWTGIHSAGIGYMAPYAYPFAAQGCMMPFAPPQRDLELAEFGMGLQGMNVEPHIMSRVAQPPPPNSFKRKLNHRDYYYGVDGERHDHHDFRSDKSTSTTTLADKRRKSDCVLSH